MCAIAGIVSVHGPLTAAALAAVPRLFVGASLRGVHAGGCAWSGPTTAGFFRAPGNPAVLAGQAPYARMEGAEVVIVHARYATNGSAAINANNHPLKRAGVTAIHNGVLADPDGFAREWGLRRRAEVDSEILPSHIGMGLETGSKVHEACADTMRATSGRGYAAVAALYDAHPGVVSVWRDNAPCVMVYDAHLGAIVFGSTHRTIEFALRDRAPEAYGFPDGRLYVMDRIAATRTVRVRYWQVHAEPPPPAASDPQAAWYAADVPALNPRVAAAALSTRQVITRSARLPKPKGGGW